MMQLSPIFLLLFRELLFFEHLQQSLVGLIKTRLISNVFADLRLHHQISTRMKLNKTYQATHICYYELKVNLQKTSGGNY